VTPLYVSLSLGLPGEQARSKAADNRNILPHTKCVSTKTWDGAGYLPWPRWCWSIFVWHVLLSPWTSKNLLWWSS